MLRPGGTFHFLEHGLCPDPASRSGSTASTASSSASCGGCHLDRPIERARARRRVRHHQLRSRPAGGPEVHAPVVVPLRRRRPPAGGTRSVSGRGGLDPDERRIWLGWVFTSRLLWEEIERDLQRDSSLSLGHYEILVMLSEAPTVPAHERAGRRDAVVAQPLCRTPSHGSRSSAGCAVRRAPPTDAVNSQCSPTTASRRSQAAAPMHVESVRRHFFDQLVAPSSSAQLRRRPDDAARAPAPTRERARRRALEDPRGSSCPARTLSGPDRGAHAGRGAASLLHRRRQHVARVRVDLHAARRPARPLRLHRGAARLHRRRRLPRRVRAPSSPGALRRPRATSRCWCAAGSCSRWAPCSAARSPPSSGRSSSRGCCSGSAAARSDRPCAAS